jgi:aspartyl protease family protein
MRYFVILAGLAIAIAGALSRLVDVTSRPKSPPAMTAAVATTAMASPAANARVFVIPRDSRGHFQVDARVDGRRIGFMVDTGASVIALTTRDAAMLGIHPAQREYTARVSTANGTVLAAPVSLNMVEVGGLVVRDVRAIVAPNETLRESLLGLSFLTRLRRFEYANGKLVLEQ